MQRENIIIASRGSKLATTQSKSVEKWINQHHPHINTKIKIIKTTGDQILNSPLSKIPEKGIFVKEIEESLLKHESDIAVHSMKDLPTELPQKLKIKAICKRENPQDILISLKYKSLEELNNNNAILGTGSLRRQNQIKIHYPNIRFKDIRGNVNTRIDKITKENIDGIILAFAGIKRLNLEHYIREIIDANLCIPAVGQGAIGVECREDDSFIHNIIGKLNHKETEECVKAERAFMKKLEGGCQIPIAAYAYRKGNDIILNAIVTSLDGGKILTEKDSKNKNEAEKLGVEIAEKLITKGAKAILKEIRQT